jgi:hypothetical protein
MTRRTALQSLIAVIAGASDPEQKTTPTKPPKPMTDDGSPLIRLSSPQPQSLRVYLEWKTITVHRGTETVTIDQDELFKALKGESK